MKTAVRPMVALYASLLVVAVLSLPAWSQAVKFNEIQLGQNGGRVVGDFNADGREDLLVTTSTSFHLLISTGTGTYTAGPTYTLPNGENLSGETVGDFNGDGRLDLAIGGNGTSFYVFLGNGNGSFQSPSTHAIGFQPGPLVAADVNHDGKLDLVTLDETTSGTTIVTYLGDGSGGFTAGPTSPDSHGIYDLWIGDFDGDGKVDLFSANCGPGGCELIVYYGDGAGHFGSPTTAGANQSNLTIADVDGDGRSDIITSTMGYINSSDQPYLSVFYGTAARTLQAAQIPTSQCTYGAVGVADFNGDHIPDLVFSEHDCSGGSSAQVAFLAGQGNRTFGAEQTVFNSTYAQQPGSSTWVLRANNSDSKPDFLFTQASSSGPAEYLLMVNETSGTFAGCAAPNSPTGFRVCAPASGSTVSSPVHFSIGASGSVPMRKVEFWVDGTKQYESLYAFSHYAFLDTTVPLAAGAHTVTIYSAGWDNSLQSKSYPITVGSATGTCSPTTTYGIHVCSPANGSTVSSPVAVNATANVPGTIYRFELWMGSTKLASVANSIDMQTSVNVPSGSHTLTFVARNTAGGKWTQSVAITVK